MNKLIRFWKETQASLIVEFALLIPAYLGLFFVIFEVGRFMLIAALVEYGLSQGALQIMKAASQQRTYNAGLVGVANVQTYSFNLFSVVPNGSPANNQVGVTAQRVTIAGGPGLEVIRAVYIQSLPSEFLRTLLGNASLALRTSTATAVTQ